MRRFMLGVLAAAATSVIGVAARAQQAESAVQKVEVTAERFAFQPSEIRTTVGTTLEVVLTSDDTTHGFRIKGEGVNVQIPKRGRGTITATFTPSKAGRYTFECSRICGAAIWISQLLAMMLLSRILRNASSGTSSWLP